MPVEVPTPYRPRAAMATGRLRVAARMRSVRPSSRGRGRRRRRSRRAVARTRRAGAQLAFGEDDQQRAGRPGGQGSQQLDGGEQPQQPAGDEHTGAVADVSRPRAGGRRRRGPAGRSRARMAEDTAKLAALTQNAGATPNAATLAPPAGASAIWEMTAADHRPLLAAISSSSPTMAGSTDAEAGLKNTRSCRQPERDGIDRREMVINERQDRGQGGTPQVRGDHDAN